MKSCLQANKRVIIRDKICTLKIGSCSCNVPSVRPTCCSAETLPVVFLCRQHFFHVPMKKVVCACSYCRHFVCLIHGVENPGRLVARSTRSLHERRDRRSASSTPVRRNRSKAPKRKGREEKKGKPAIQVTTKY